MIFGFIHLASESSCGPITFYVIPIGFPYDIKVQMRALSKFFRLHSHSRDRFPVIEDITRLEWSKHIRVLQLSSLWRVIEQLADTRNGWLPKP